MPESNGIDVYLVRADMRGEEGEHITLPAVPRVGERLLDARRETLVGEKFVVVEVRYILVDGAEGDESFVMVIITPDEWQDTNPIRFTRPSRN
jgi:hypothetical protein